MCELVLGAKELAEPGAQGAGEETQQAVEKVGRLCHREPWSPRASSTGTRDAEKRNTLTGFALGEMKKTKAKRSLGTCGG